MTIYPIGESEIPVLKYHESMARSGTLQTSAFFAFADIKFWQRLSQHRLRITSVALPFYLINQTLWRAKRKHSSKPAGYAAAQMDSCCSTRICSKSDPTAQPHDQPHLFEVLPRPLRPTHTNEILLDREPFPTPASATPAPPLPQGRTDELSPSQATTVDTTGLS